ncbi:phosphatase PAP2 family protein [Halopiger djelfimassiliensis]|uniref:phosphatase PAP2 family protein n=1 Tax=Halopiger djelfimassiliensis TaxID=1293047 RepID=UPI000677916C|nr:phosphatase PAP2 family protein [Halopiger djelfimassiliensis]
MSRGVGEFGPLQEVIPEWAAVLVALVTQLGDVWFLALLVGSLYLFRPDRREDAAIVTGLLLAGLSTVTALKHVFALPRPEQPLVALETLPVLIRPLYEATATADGYGFPSGHAFITTVVYTSLAGRLSIGTLRQRVLGAATIVAVVCLSRVALGVHYLVDVVAGVGIGLAFVLVAGRAVTRVPSDEGVVAFSLAVVLGAVAFVVSSADPDAVLLLGASLGTFGGWQLHRLGRTLRPDSPPSDAVRPVVHAGLPALVAFTALLAAIVAVPVRPIFALAGVLGLVIAAFVTVPSLTRSDSDLRTTLGFVYSVVTTGVRSLLRS